MIHNIKINNNPLCFVYAYYELSYLHRLEMGFIYLLYTIQNEVKLDCLIPFILMLIWVEYLSSGDENTSKNQFKPYKEDRIHSLLEQQKAIYKQNAHTNLLKRVPIEQFLKFFLFL